MNDEQLAAPVMDDDAPFDAAEPVPPVTGHESGLPAEAIFGGKIERVAFALRETGSDALPLIRDLYEALRRAEAVLRGE